MISDPIHPIIAQGLTQVLNEMGLSPKAASASAMTIIKKLHRMDLDIVRGSWMRERKEGITWNDLAAVAESVQAIWGDREPWNSPELK